MPKDIAEELAKQFSLAVCSTCGKEEEIIAASLREQARSSFKTCCGRYAIWLRPAQVPQYRLQKEQSSLRNKKIPKALDISLRSI